jgi:GT2 family glycosyltransferase
MAESAKRNDAHHVTAILVVHDGATWLPEVVASLASQTRAVNSTIAIDTGSVDSSTKLLRNSRIPFVSISRESGFGDAVNSAIENLPDLEGEDEWLWFIHDDCAPANTALAELLRAIEDRPHVAIVGPKLRGWYDRTHLLEAGVSIAGNGARWTGLEIREYDQGQRDGIRDVLSVSTAGMLVRREVFEELGGFDSNLSLFRDDVDLGWRARVAGHSVIVATDSVAYHAEASASERRNVDVSHAFLHRPLLLDRRNASYVLLVNSSFWILPWLSLRLLISAATRSIGYLIAKLPGYAADEILAVGLLLIHPSLLLNARKVRRSQRMLSSRVVANFIPPRWMQFRLSINRTVETLRERFFPTPAPQESILDPLSDDEDLLVPAPSRNWKLLVIRPEILGIVFLFVLTALWSRHRYGSITGGALSTTPSGAMDLWRSYADSWHGVGMGSSFATPTWIAILALASTLTFGNVPLLMGILFWISPIFLMWSMYVLARTFTSRRWLAVGASVCYALSPVAISAINQGRLGTLITLICGPIIVKALPRLNAIQSQSWRFIFGLSLLVGAATAFSLPFYLAIASIFLSAGVKDYFHYRSHREDFPFQERISRWLLLLATPFALCLPWSFEALTHPSRILSEPGLSLPGGLANVIFLGNPGGVGSIPWWCVGPATFIILISLFSSTNARIYAQWGFGFLISATLISTISISAHGSAASTRVWVGTWLTISTICAVVSGVIILDGLRERLASSNIHYRHLLAGLGVASVLVYSVTATVWIVTSGANSPVQVNNISVLPPFLGISPTTKTLVIRNSNPGPNAELSFFLAREKDALLGDPDVAPTSTPAIDKAIRDLIDGSGLTSSKILSAHGIKYLFMKNPVDQQLVRSVDGIGGFVRISSTDAGIVWKIIGAGGRLVFTGQKGVSTPLSVGSINGRILTQSPGTLTLAENYDSSWQIIQNGAKLVRTKNEYGLPQFLAPTPGEFFLIHDGTVRRGWLSLQIIVLLSTLVMILPAGRRKREISVEELT